MVNYNTEKSLQLVSSLHNLYNSVLSKKLCKTDIAFFRQRTVRALTLFCQKIDTKPSRYFLQQNTVSSFIYTITLI